MHIIPFIIFSILIIIACKHPIKENIESGVIHWKNPALKIYPYLDTRYSFEQCFPVFYIGTKFDETTLDNFSPLEPKNYHLRGNIIGDYYYHFHNSAFHGKRCKANKNDLKLTIKKDTEIPVAVFSKLRNSAFTRSRDTFLFSPVIIENISNHCLEIIFEDQVELQIEIKDKSGFWSNRVLPFQYFCGTGAQYYRFCPNEIIVSSIPVACHDGP